MRSALRLTIPLALFALAIAPAASAAQRVTRATQLANGCFTLESGRTTAGPFFLEPTGLGTNLLYDRERKVVTLDPPDAIGRADAPSAAAEWSISRARGGRFTIRSAANAARALTPSGRRGFAVGATATRWRLERARRCATYPEAALGARGRSFAGKRRDGTVLGFADMHMHVAADLRGGGLVISGKAFDRFGIPVALGNDPEVHGEDGGLDITGNLLRSGSPAGTHDTDGWPTFSGWPTPDTYTHQQVYWRWLERAWLGGLRLLGAQAVEDEPLCNIEPRKNHSCDETETIELQVQRLRELQDYVDAQYGGRGRGWFRIVEGPRAARRVIERGKLAVVIGAESSNPFGCAYRGGQPQCTREDIDRGIERLRRVGVRTLFPAHWVDNALAGAALEGGDKGTFIAAMQVSSTGAPFGTGPCPYATQGEEIPPLPGRQCNTRGLTELGDYALRRLMDAGMLIEADHMSEWSRQRLLAIAEERGYPVVSSHTGTGGLWTPDELRRLYGVGGMTSATIEDAAKMPDKLLGVRRYQSANKTLGVGIATDTGGFNALPGPQPQPPSYPFRPYRGRVSFDRQRSGTKTYDIGKDGMSHYGLLPDLLASVQAQPRGREALGLLYRSAEAYLQMWERAEARSSAGQSRKATAPAAK